MSILSFLFGDTNTAPPDPVWQRDSSMRFYRLLAMRPGKPNLKGRSGVFAVFHKGVQPGWVYVGSATDLQQAVELIQDHPEISALEARGGLYITWSYVRADKRDGVVAFLRARMAPEVTAPDLDQALGCRPGNAKPIPVQLPG